MDRKFLGGVIFAEDAFAVRFLGHIAVSPCQAEGDIILRKGMPYQGS